MTEVVLICIRVGVAHQDKNPRAARADERDEDYGNDCVTVHVVAMLWLGLCLCSGDEQNP